MISRTRKPPGGIRKFAVDMYIYIYIYTHTYIHMGDFGLDMVSIWFLWFILYGIYAGYINHINDISIAGQAAELQEGDDIASYS